MALTIPLLTAERAWAQAMHLQSESASPSSSTPHISASLARSQIIRRLAAAAKAARQLRAACSGKASASTLLQAEAYTAWLEGSHALERRDFPASLKHFLLSDKVYSELAAVAGLELRALCDERSSQLRLYIAFCRNRIQKMIEQGELEPEAGSNLSEESEDSVGLLAKQSAEASELSEYLRSKFDSVMQESLATRATAWRSFIFDGVEINVRDERVRVGLLTCETLSQQLAGLLSGTSETMSDETSRQAGGAPLFALFNKLISTYDEMISVIKESLAGVRRAGVQTSDVQQEAFELTCLLKYALFSKLSLSLKRNASQCFRLCDKFEREVITAATGAAGDASPETRFAVASAQSLSPSVTGSSVNTTTGASLSSVKPSSLVTLYDRLLQNLEDLTEVLPQKTTAEESSLTEASEDLRAGLALRSEIYAALRGFYIAQCYVFQQPRPMEAYVVLKEVQQTLQKVIEKLQTQPLSTSTSTFSSLEEEKVACRRALELTNATLPRVQALVVAQQHITNASAASAISKLSLQENGKEDKNSILSTGSAVNGDDLDSVLLERLDVFSSGRESSGNHPNKYRLLDFPPRFVTTSIKPFLFDLAGSTLDYPDFSHRVKVDPREKKAAIEKQKQEEEANKGFWGRIFG